jgi:sugar phosphate isomerase/epimerase
MALSPLPLGYCTNVHPGRSVAEVLHGLDTFTRPVAERFGKPMAAGLWLAQPVIAEILSDPAGPPRFRDELVARDLTCHTLNAFPYGDFHSERVKENVYIPDWSEPRRLDYTRDCATVLAALIPGEVDGSMSTLPLGFKQFPHPPEFNELAAGNLIQLAGFLARMHAETGKRIRLAVEPEPLCLLETTDEALDFFAFLHDRADAAGAAEAVREHVGVCYDVCHQAVEFEDVADSLRRFAQAGVRINKVHITCALKIANPAANREAREALARYVEPRYLHQTIARRADGTVVRAVDLTRDLALQPPAEFAAAEEWRVHFHVPVDAEQLGPLGTTRAELKQALRAVAALHDAPHLEVETYTWEVLPDGEKTDLVEGLTAEMNATAALLHEL